MKLSKTSRLFVAFLLVPFIFLFGQFSRVDALEYFANLEFDITLNEDLSASVTQNILVKNHSEEFLSSSLSLDFPFSKVESLKVESGGRLLPASIENNRLWIEFFEDPLNYREQKAFNISYKVPNAVNDLGSIKSFSFPKFTIEEEDTNYIVRVNYPVQWDEVAYSSQNIDLSNTFEYRRVLAFNLVNKPLQIYIGKYSIKEVSLGLDSKIKANGLEMRFPHEENIYFLGDSDIVNTSIRNQKSDVYIYLKKYKENKDFTILSKPKSDFSDGVYSQMYFDGVEKLVGFDTNDYLKLYKLVLSRLEPASDITEWSRINVLEILNKDTHNDLDYASLLTAVFQSKGIPSNIVYGLVKYPDGHIYWHFWNVYLEKQDQKTIWREVDPYLEDLTGQQFFQNVNPERIIWGVLDNNSDLKDVNTNIFYFAPTKFRFKYFSSPSEQTGYITSQLYARKVYEDDEGIGSNSVLGTKSIRLPEVTIGLNGGAIISLMTGIILITFARYFYITEKRYLTKRKFKAK